MSVTYCTYDTYLNNSIVRKPPAPEDEGVYVLVYLVKKYGPTKINKKSDMVRRILSWTVAFNRSISEASI